MCYFTPMTISSHLTPDPERRLLIMLESMIRSVEEAERRIGALTALAAAEAAYIKIALPGGPTATLALAALGAALPLGVLAFSPLTRMQGRLFFLDPSKDNAGASYSLVTAETLAKHSQRELILVLDRYLGGGITATPYFEDLIGQIILRARAAVRKQRLFAFSCLLVGIGQLALLGRLLCG